MDIPRINWKDMHPLTLSRRITSSLIAICTLFSLISCGSDNHRSTPAAATYTVGGTISGLSGAGIVLVNGSDTVSVDAGAKTFTLPTAIPTGTSYAVTIQTQPSEQTCTVANGSGKIQSANVANVVVTCAVNAFRVGGTVSGLNGSGLMLANGGDSVGVNAGATAFTLPTAVATGSSYTVTVKTQPAGEACAVSSGMGTMASGAVTNVSVACSDQPFNLGGSVSGLTTTGLVLANGSDTLSVAANAASFTMPTPVAYDTAYAITVRTQPTGLTCSVSGGSNTMPANAVTTVVVSCSPRAYALGGTVSGLTAGSVILTDGMDTITVNAANATFIMPTAIAFGGHYALTVQTQPSGLICSLGGNSSGTMPAAGVSVIMTCSPDTYMLGGTISGLSTSGLVLANGSDTLVVAANATQFTMNNSVAFGSAYRVAVAASPVGEWCTLAGGSGTATVDLSSIVQITCAAITAGTLTTWTVPAGVTSIQVVATGGGGGGGGQAGGGPAGSGGNGAAVTATLAVQQGDELSFYVGGGGSSNTEGGGGGGLSYVIVNTDASKMVLAGGGGGGGSGRGGIGGDGGSAGANGGSGLIDGLGGAAGSGGTGGIGGTSNSGSNGGDGNAFTDIATTDSGSGGNGSGGGTANGGVGISGVIGNGGHGGSNWGAGGGGGGYGGGGSGGNGSYSTGCTNGSCGGGGGGGGGNLGPAGTAYGAAPSGSAGAGGAGSLPSGAGTVGNQGSIIIALNP